MGKRFELAEGVTLEAPEGWLFVSEEQTGGVPALVDAQQRVVVQASAFVESPEDPPDVTVEELGEMLVEQAGQFGAASPKRVETGESAELLWAGGEWPAGGKASKDLMRLWNVSDRRNVAVVTAVAEARDFEAVREALQEVVESVRFGGGERKRKPAAKKKKVARKKRK